MRDARHHAGADRFRRRLRRRGAGASRAGVEVRADAPAGFVEHFKGAEMDNKELFEKGLAIRKAVVGAEYVEKSMASADDFNRPLQELVTEYCWGAVGAARTLLRKTRSMLNLAMISVLNRPHELKLHRRRRAAQWRLEGRDPRGVPAGGDLRRSAGGDRFFRIAREAFAEADAKNLEGNIPHGRTSHRHPRNHAGAFAAGYPAADLPALTLERAHESRQHAGLGQHGVDIESTAALRRMERALATAGDNAAIGSPRPPAAGPRRARQRGGERRGGSDDSDLRSIAHIGTIVSAAGLAMAEASRFVGRDPLAAMVLGEIAGRIDESLTPGACSGFHGSVSTIFSAATVAGRPRGVGCRTHGTGCRAGGSFRLRHGDRG